MAQKLLVSFQEENPGWCGPYQCNSWGESSRIKGFPHWSGGQLQLVSCLRNTFRGFPFLDLKLESYTETSFLPGPSQLHITTEALVFLGLQSRKLTGTLLEWNMSWIFEDSKMPRSFFVSFNFFKNCTVQTVQMSISLKMNVCMCALGWWCHIITQVE